MDKEIQNIYKEISNLLRAYSMVITPNTLSNKYKYSNHPESSNIYRDNKIYELIVLVRIERLFDLGQINEETKEMLKNLYNQYRIVYEQIGKDLQEEQKNGKSVDRIHHSRLRNKLNVIADKLNEYSLLDEFDYESAFLNEIDAKILKKK